MRNLPYINELVWDFKNIFFGSVQPFNKIFNNLSIKMKLPFKLPNLMKNKKVLFVTNNLACDYWLKETLPFAYLASELGGSVTHLHSICNTEIDLYKSRFMKWSKKRIIKTEKIKFDLFCIDNFDNIVNIDKTLVEKTADFDVRYLLRKEKTNQNLRNDKKLYEWRYLINANFYSFIYKYIKNLNPDLILTPNGGFFEYGITKNVATKLGVKCVTYETCEDEAKLAISQTDAILNWDFNENWEKYSQENIESYKNWFEQFVNTRADPENIKRGVYVTQHIGPQDGKELILELGLNLDKPIILMPTNVPWDSSILNKGRAFSTMREWIVETIKYFKLIQNVQLIVRAHPSENRWKQFESVVEIIKREFLILPKNIVLIKPDDKINSYSLLPYVKYGIVYATTFGLEMAALGNKIVTVANVHYANKGFTSDPASPKEYFDLLKNLNCQNIIPDQHNISLAIKYAHFYFNYNSSQIPWKCGVGLDAFNNLIDPRQVIDSPGIQKIFCLNEH